MPTHRIGVSFWGKQVHIPDGNYGVQRARTKWNNPQERFSDRFDMTEKRINELEGRPIEIIEYVKQRGKGVQKLEEIWLQKPNN